MADRRQFALGKGPVIRDPRTPALQHCMAEKPVAANIDWRAAIGDWSIPYLDQSDVNNQVGCCVWAAAARGILQRTTYAGRPVRMTGEQVIEAYRSTGYVPGDPATDRGTIASVALAYQLQRGLMTPTGIDQLAAVAHCPLDITWFRRAIEATGSVQVGVQFPASAEDGRFLWDVAGDMTSTGGHFLLLTRAVETDGFLRFTAESWGNPAGYLVTPEWLERCADEAYVVLDHDFMTSAGVDPADVDWQALQAFVATISAAA